MQKARRETQQLTAKLTTTADSERKRKFLETIKFDKLSANGDDESDNVHDAVLDQDTRQALRDVGVDADNDEIAHLAAAVPSYVSTNAPKSTLVAPPAAHDAKRRRKSESKRRANESALDDDTLAAFGF